MSSDALTLQLLEWVAKEPRSYVEVMEAWRTSCPHLPIWEDALKDGLIERVGAARTQDARVRIIEAGKARLMMYDAVNAP
jgi:hypothetical protein